MYRRYAKEHDVSTYGSSYYGKSRFEFYDTCLIQGIASGKDGATAAKNALAALQARDESYDFVSPKTPPEEVGYDASDPAVKALLEIVEKFPGSPAADFAHAALIGLDVIEALDEDGEESSDKPIIASVEGEPAAVKTAKGKPAATSASANK